MYAARDGHESTVSLLLKYNADIFVTDQNDWTALKYASSFPTIMHILESEMIKRKGTLVWIFNSF